MRLGFDGKWFHDGPPSGRLVVRHLVEALARAAVGHELVVFLDRRHRGARTPRWPHVRYEYVWGGNTLIANQTVVPRLADRLGLDAVLYQNFAPVLARHGRVAFIYDAIFDDHPEFFTRRERLLFAPMRWLAARAERVCTISASERDRLVRLGYGPAERVIAAPLGVPHGFVAQLPIDARARLARHELPERYLLYVGRLNVRKNIGNLLRALTLTADQSIPLVVVGAPDWKSSDWPTEARSLGVAARVRFLGHVADEEVPLIYGGATALCFASFDEGFGLPALEAMAVGTPVIASRIPSLAEVCGNAAMFVNPYDPRDIAHTIDLVLANSELVRGLRVAGVERASGFSWKRTANAVLNALMEAGTRSSY